MKHSLKPDFIIGGAPKCGTTSLHGILDQHPDIWVARNEVYFFDADDPIAHSDFLKTVSGELSWRHPTDPDFREWYEKRFEDAPAGALLGEDTTTYLMSDVAPVRICAENPEAKIVFMLRDPVRRAFSQYWHLLRSGRTSLSFEEAISAEPSIILGSTYAPKLRQFIEAMGSEQAHVLLFEEFNSDRQQAIDGVTGFLGASSIRVDQIETWFNRTHYPKNSKTLMRLNRLGKILVQHRYARHFDGSPSIKSRLLHKAYRRWFRFISSRVLTEDKPPEDMRPKTQEYLRKHLSDRNAGLSDLLGKDLSKLWLGFTQ